MGDEPYVVGTSLGQAYKNALDRYLDGINGRHMVIECHHPVATTDDIPMTTEVTRWEDHLRLGDIYIPYADYDFGVQSDKTGGSTGEDWLTDRIMALESGGYRDRLRAPDQLQMIVDRLKLGLHGSSTNALVAQVFQDDDLRRACRPKPNNDGMACISQLQFHPTHDRLNLHMTMRSQYLGIKGYPNLVAAGVLLAYVCAETGYTPGTIVEHVNNVTSHSAVSLDDLHERLTPMPPTRM